MGGIAVVVLGPAAEEIIFRALVLGALLRLGSRTTHSLAAQSGRISLLAVPAALAGAIGICAASQKTRTGPQQLVAGSRNLNFSTIARRDLSSIDTQRVAAAR